MRHSAKFREKFSLDRTRRYSTRNWYAKEIRWPGQPPLAWPHPSGRNAGTSNGAIKKQRPLSGRTGRRGSPPQITRLSHKGAPHTLEGPQCCRSGLRALPPWPGRDDLHCQLHNTRCVPIMLSITNVIHHVPGELVLQRRQRSLRAPGRAGLHGVRLAACGLPQL
jgi:hypothetical protein